MGKNSEKNAEASSAISTPAEAAVALGDGGNGGTVGDPREDDDILKRRISCHPLYGLLIENHLDCLKASMADIEGLPINSANQANNKINTSMPGSSDLDHFMEMYCMALSELKKAIEEPVQETTAFIDGMYFQLMELTGMGTHATHTSPTSPGDGSSRAHHDQEAQFVHDLGGSTGDYVNNDQIIDSYVSNGCRECSVLFTSTLQSNPAPLRQEESASSSVRSTTYSTIVGYIRTDSANRPKILAGMDIRLSQADTVDPDDLDEEFDTMSSTKPSDIIRVQYDRLEGSTEELDFFQ